MVELLATSSTKEGIIKLIKNYWYTDNVQLIPIEGKQEKYIVANGKGNTHFTVTKQKGRYRFEG